MALRRSARNADKATAAESPALDVPPAAKSVKRAAATKKEATAPPAPPPKREKKQSAAGQKRKARDDTASLLLAAEPPVGLASAANPLAAAIAPPEILLPGPNAALDAPRSKRGKSAGTKAPRRAAKTAVEDADLVPGDAPLPRRPVAAAPPSATAPAAPLSAAASPRKRVLPLPDVGSPRKAAGEGDSLLREAEAHLVRVDGQGKLGRLIGGARCEMFGAAGLAEVVDPFTALASGIIGQQVSGAAASSIRKKFTALFEDTHPEFPSPAQVLTKDLPTLRTAGLSQRKAEYISGLAEKFASGEFTADGLKSASDEELITQLVAVRGLGRWSVEMFACFGLKRMDVFSTGDLGVQRGMAAYMGRDVSKLKNKGGKWKYMSEQEMLSIASQFAPYRSLFMWYMWRIADVETEVLE
ncbi:DNA glycosylase [Boeremia exigua]|uniref:DNA glycosylase n=1 Tax=Boeremia exigua TaxID=749465 RepID=UPI001E8D4200|nr:DNA glycosylase [Boeremia exigua]KAH6639768.1 DNA glycosylase [Boeremia exigua]